MLNKVRYYNISWRVTCSCKNNFFIPSYPLRKHQIITPQRDWLRRAGIESNHAPLSVLHKVLVALTRGWERTTPRRLLPRNLQGGIPPPPPRNSPALENSRGGTGGGKEERRRDGKISWTYNLKSRANTSNRRATLYPAAEEGKAASGEDATDGAEMKGIALLLGVDVRSERGGEGGKKKRRGDEGEKKRRGKAEWGVQGFKFIRTSPWAVEDDLASVWHVLCLTVRWREKERYHWLKLLILISMERAKLLVEILPYPEINFFSRNIVFSDGTVKVWDFSLYFDKSRLLVFYLFFFFFRWSPYYLYVR